MTFPNPKIHARYLAPGGAHVIVLLDDAALPDSRQRYRTDCEACGTIPGSDCGWGNTDVPSEYARNHAATCRRIPERLWPEGGEQR